MKPKVLLLGVFIVVLILGFIFSFFPPGEVAQSPTNVDPMSGSTSAQENPTGEPEALQDRDIPVVSPEPKEQASYVKLFKEVMGWGRTPIEFYGKVVDEGGRGIPGAEIKISINDFSPGGTSVSYQKSDGQGQFVIRDVKGKHLYIETSKEGYYDGSESYRGFQYAGVGGNFSPDPNNPEIFRLRKMGERVPLVKGQRLWGLPTDGRRRSIDLIAGKIRDGEEKGAHLTVSFTRMDAVGSMNYDWEFIVFAPAGGGVLVSDEEFMHHAPETGYRSEVKIGQKGVAYAVYPLKLYLKINNGEMFATLSMEIHPKYQDRGAVDVKWILNPDGSRNLEPDPERPIQVRTHLDGSVSLIYPKGYEPKAP